MIVDTKIEFKDQNLNSDKKKKDALSHPRSLSLSKGLNSIASLDLRYSKQLETSVFSQDDKAHFPSEVRVLVKIQTSKSSSDTVERQIFRGVLDGYELDLTKEQITLTYVDPLIQANEIDESHPFQLMSLKKIVEKLFENAFGRAQGARSVKAEFLTDDLNVEEASNVGMTDLEFLKEICSRYGFFFFYDSSDQNSEKVKFFRPDFSKKSKVQIQRPELGRDLRYASRSNTFLNNAIVHGREGDAETKIRDYEKRFGEVFQEKAKARKQSGIELVSHYYFPNFSSAEATAVSLARFMEAALSGDALHFASERVLQVGDYFDIIDDSKASKLDRLIGTYLLSEVQSHYEGSVWQHEYRGIRP